MTQDARQMSIFSFKKYMKRIIIKKMKKVRCMETKGR